MRVSRRGSRTWQWVARGAEEGLAIGSSFFHDSLVTGEREKHCTKVRQEQTCRLWWASWAEKDVVVSSGISNERNVDGGQVQPVTTNY